MRKDGAMPEHVENQNRTNDNGLWKLLGAVTFFLCVATLYFNCSPAGKRAQQDAKIQSAKVDALFNGAASIACAKGTSKALTDAGFDPSKPEAIYQAMQLGLCPVNPR
jgi:hypothetical protein